MIFTSTRFFSSAAELPVKDLLPRPEAQPPFGHCHNDFPPYDLPLDVRIGIVFPRVVVAILAHRLMRRDLFQPRVVVMVQPDSSPLMNTGAAMCMGLAMHSQLPLQAIGLAG